MPKSRNHILAGLLVLGVVSGGASRAEALEAEYAPIVFKPNDDTTLRLIFWNQVWARLIQNNPSSDPTVQDVTPDVGIRRARFLAFGRIRDDVLMVFHIGINNQTFLQNDFGSGGPNFFVHDAWTEFKITASDMFRLDFGGGLIYWNGISRMTNASTLNLLAVDSPITSWANINGTDQFARQLGLYVKGAVAGGWVDYRIALVKPFVSGLLSPPEGQEGRNGRFDNPNDTWGVSSYFKVQLMDKESNVLPYMVGTYLGKKSVLNIGFGEHYQPGAGSINPENGDIGDISIWGFDVFADLPFGEAASGGALTAYGLVQLSDYGEGDNLIHTGIMPLAEPANPNVVNGSSNKYGLLGDGTTIYAQVGYLLPGEMMGLQIQPYVTAQFNLWDAYEDVAQVYEVGSNFYLEGHNAKFTLHYRARPVFVEGATPNDKATFDSFASEAILQMMIFL